MLEEEKKTVEREHTPTSENDVSIVVKSSSEENHPAIDLASDESNSKSTFSVKFEPGLSDYLSELAQSHHFQTGINEVNILKPNSNSNFKTKKLVVIN